MEILGVITLLAIISLIIILSVNKSLKDSKETLYQQQLEEIKAAANMWKTDNIELIPNEDYYIVSLQQLKEQGYIKGDIINPKTDELFDNITVGVGMNDIKIDTIENLLTNNGYTRLDYIKSTGTQYIDTDISYDENNEYIIECDVAATTTNSKYSGWNGGGIFGVSYTKWGDGIGYTEKLYDVLQKTKIKLTIEKDLSSATVMEMTQDNLYDTIKRRHDNIAQYTNLNYPIFAYTNNNDLKGFISMKLWYMKISVNNNIVRDFIPCLRKSDNEPGLYDMVNNKFYTNDGTGSFEYGELN